MNDIEALKARIDIITLKARHMRMLDTKNWDGYAALITDDFLLDLSQAIGLAPVRGREAVMAVLKAALNDLTIVHQVHVPEFEFRGDNDVFVIWAIQDRLVPRSDKPTSTGYTQHHDLWIRRNGAWKHAEHKLIRLQNDIFPAASSGQSQ